MSLTIRLFFCHIQDTITWDFQLVIISNKEKKEINIPWVTWTWKLIFILCTKFECQIVLGPTRSYHSRLEWTWEQCQWRGTANSLELQNWRLTIRLSRVISWTLVGGGSYFSAEMQSAYSTAPTARAVLWRASLRAIKRLQKQTRTFLAFMVMVSLLTGFQNFVLSIRHWEKNPDQDAPQTSLRMF